MLGRLWTRLVSLFSRRRARPQPPPASWQLKNPIERKPTNRWEANPRTERPTLLELEAWKNDPELIPGHNATYVHTAIGFSKVPARVYYGFYRPQLDKWWEQAKQNFPDEFQSD